MTSSKPYLIRGIYDWILDNNLTPHLLVDTHDPGVRVPTQYVKDHTIVLNIAPTAVRDLQLGNDYIMFSARFSGNNYEIVVPVSSARMIYAKENGRGLVLPDDEPEAALEPAVKEPKASGEKAAKPPHLTIVK